MLYPPLPSPTPLPSLCRTFLVLAFCVLATSAFASIPASYTGSNGNWSAGANWSTNPTVPLNVGGNTYAVSIPNVTVAYDVGGSGAIDSLGLTSGTLNLKSGCNLSVLDGLTAGSGTLTATNAAFTVTGASTIDSSYLTAAGGATISIPVAAFASTRNVNWQASGASSLVELSNLTTVSLGTSTLALYALTGGKVDLPALTTVTGTTGTFYIQASSANSTVNIPLISPTLSYVNVTATGGGTVNWGSPTTLQASSIALDAASTLNTVSLTNIDSTSINFSGPGSLSIPLVTGISALAGTGAVVQANANATLNLPAVTTITNPGDVFSSIRFVANGASAKLTMNAVTSVTNNASGISVQAQAGGDVEMTALASVNNLGSIFGSFSVSADGANSKVLMPALATLHLVGQADTLSATNGGYLDVHTLSTITNTGNVFESLSIQSTGAGSVVNLPLLGNAAQTKLGVTVGTGGSILWGSPTIIQASSITLDTAGTLNTASLTNIDSTNLSATNGATLSVPVATYLASTQSTTWGATAAGSLVQLANLTAITLSSANLTLSAQTGGSIQLPALTTISATSATLNLQTSGAGSTINVPLIGGAPLSHLNVSLNGGTVNWGSPSTLQASTVSITTSGSIALAQLTNIDSTGLTAGGGAVISLPAITAYSTVLGTGANFEANVGSTITLPALTSLTNPGNVFDGVTFLANGAGAKISMNAVTSVTTNAASMTFQAQNGGLLEMTSLTSAQNLGIIFGNFNAYADGAGSRVSMPALTTLHLFGETDNLRATAGGYLDMHSLRSVTSTGNIFENLSVQSTGARSIVDLSELLSSVPFPDSFAIGSGGEVLFGTLPGPKFLSFKADFTNATGSLDIYLDGSFFTSIPSNDLNTVESYSFPFTGPVVANPSFAFISNGASAAVTVSDYLVAPEPGSLALLGLAAGAVLLRRRR